MTVKRWRDEKSWGGASYRRRVVLPDPDPVPTVGRGWWARQLSRSRVRASLVGAHGGWARRLRTTPIRLAGLRSGTHGGARVVGTPAIAFTRTGVSCGRPWGAGRGVYELPRFVLPDSDPVPTVGRGPGAASTNHPHSSCRTPIRYPRWGAGERGRHPYLQPRPSSTYRRHTVPHSSSSPTPIGDRLSKSSPRTK